MTDSTKSSPKFNLKSELARHQGLLEVSITSVSLTQIFSIIIKLSLLIIALEGICRNPHACRNFHEAKRGCRNPTIIRQLNNVASFLSNDHLQVAFSSLLAKATIN